MVRHVVEKVRAVTDKPIKYVIPSHYHAVRVLGASAYQRKGSLPRKKPIDLSVQITESSIPDASSKAVGRKMAVRGLCG
jgi:hypothetical protein